MFFATSAAPSFFAANGATCLYSVPTRARSSSSSTGSEIAPGRWSSANSAGERASMTASNPGSPPDGGVPGRLRRGLMDVVEEIRALETRVTACERELQAIADTHPIITQLQTIPGVGLVTATALVAAVGHIGGFTRGRRFASWLGLTPREHSSGSRRRLGAITKAGNRYLRSLLTHGARAALFAARRRAHAHRPLSTLQQWALTVLDRRGANRATIALANKLARIVWAVWTRDVPYTARLVAAERRRPAAVILPDAVLSE